MPDLETDLAQAEALIEERREQLARYHSPEERAKRREARAALLVEMWVAGKTRRIAVQGTIADVRAYAAQTGEDWLFADDRLAEDGLALEKNGAYALLRPPPPPKKPAEAP